jgi:hypothetical protein
MSTITADPNMKSVLCQVTDVTEIRDANGNLMGIYMPKGKTDEELLKLFDLDRARATLTKEKGQGRPLKEILDRLHAQEKHG